MVELVAKDVFLLWLENASFMYASGSYKGFRREFRVTHDSRFKVLLNGKPLYFGDNLDQAIDAYETAFKSRKSNA